jgi:hypothetical protein
MNNGLEIRGELSIVSAVSTPLILIAPGYAQDERHLPPDQRSEAYKAGLRSAARKGVEKRHCYARIFTRNATQNERGGWDTIERAFAPEMHRACGISD